MYRKRDKNQLTMEEFYLPFGEGLRSDNRWVRMSKLIPWDLVEEIYADRLSAEKGRAAIPSRIAFGALYIKEQENLTDAGTVMYLSENPYAQYFVGLKEFRTEPLFDASMMVHFRKRFGPEMVAKINERLYEQTNPQEKDPPDGLGGESPEDGTGTQEDSSANKGVMILDATVAPADIHYPTDLALLNACREGTEKIIDRLWALGSCGGHKAAYSRKKARRSFLSVAKQRKAKLQATRRAVASRLTMWERVWTPWSHCCRRLGRRF